VIMLQMLLTSFLCLLFAKDDFNVTQKILLFIIVQILSASTLLGVGSIPALDYYILVNLVHISAFLVISNYRCTLYEKWIAYIILTFLVADTLFVYFNTWLSGVWISYLGNFKSDLFVMWLIAIVIGDHKDQVRYWHKVILVLIIWWLSGLITYT